MGWGGVLEIRVSVVEARGTAVSIKTFRRLLILLPRPVHGDGPWRDIVAEPGRHLAFVNPLGAVFVTLPDGSYLGIKPGEFEALAEDVGGLS